MVTSLLNDGVNDTLCGVITTFFATLFLTMNIIILHLLNTRKTQFNAPVYHQLFHMGINDCMQLSIHTIGGFCILLQYDLPDTLNKVFGAIINCAWFSWIAFSYSLSFNRFLAFCYPRYYDTFFSKRNTRYQIAACWTAMLFTLVIYLSPFCTMQFYRLTFEWQYNKSTPWHSILHESELYWACLMMPLSFINYGFIVIRMKSMNKASNIRRRGKQEIRVCIQAACLCIYTTFVQLHWHFQEYYMPTSRYSNLSANSMWVFNCGMNPILCLTVNLSIKNAFLDLIHVKKQKTCITVTIAPYS
uniref:G_PROTEIN_RECEP_F1_2 domain-containing protein n=1 Tax=Panagrellus redivivus TaxID=6233 RepID=A0A7E4W5U9_PANRE